MRRIKKTGEDANNEVARLKIGHAKSVVAGGEYMRCQGSKTSAEIKITAKQNQQTGEVESRSPAMRERDIRVRRRSQDANNKVEILRRMVTCQLRSASTPGKKEGDEEEGEG